jgi:hypothetical protein
MGDAMWVRHFMLCYRREVRFKDIFSRLNYLGNLRGCVRRGMKSHVEGRYDESILIGNFEMNFWILWWDLTSFGVF